MSEPVRPKHSRICELLATGFKAVLWGELPSMPATELFGVVSQGRKTGFLFIERDGVERVFGFVEGELVFGLSTAPTEAEDARKAVLGLLHQQPGGTFTFLRGPSARVPHSLPPQNTQEVVLDALRQLDETRRLVG